MSSDQMPGGLDRILNDLRARVTELERQAGIKTGLQITKASGPFTLPAGSGHASAPASGVVLYHYDGRMWFRFPDGTQRVIPAGDVSNASFSSGSISNPPTQAQVTAIQSGLVSAVSAINNLLTSLRNAKQIG